MRQKRKATARARFAAENTGDLILQWQFSSRRVAPARTKAVCRHEPAPYPLQVRPGAEIVRFFPGALFHEGGHVVLFVRRCSAGTRTEDEVTDAMKTMALQGKTRFHGLDRVGRMFTFAAAAYNLVRMRNH